MGERRSCVESAVRGPSLAKISQTLDFDQQYSSLGLRANKWFAEELQFEEVCHPEVEECLPRAPCVPGSATAAATPPQPSDAETSEPDCQPSVQPGPTTMSPSSRSRAAVWSRAVFSRPLAAEQSYGDLLWSGSAVPREALQAHKRNSLASSTTSCAADCYPERRLLCPFFSRWNFPFPRTRHAVAVLKNRIYCFGGSVGESYRHNIQSDLWEFTITERLSPSRFANCINSVAGDGSDAASRAVAVAKGRLHRSARRVCPPRVASAQRRKKRPGGFTLKCRYRGVGTNESSRRKTVVSRYSRKAWAVRYSGQGWLDSIGWSHRRRRPAQLRRFGRRFSQQMKDIPAAHDHRERSKSDCYVAPRQRKGLTQPVKDCAATDDDITNCLGDRKFVCEAAFLGPTYFDWSLLPNRSHPSAACKFDCWRSPVSTVNQSVAPVTWCKVESVPGLRGRMFSCETSDRNVPPASRLPTQSAVALTSWPSARAGATLVGHEATRTLWLFGGHGPSMRQPPPKFHFEPNLSCGACNLFGPNDVRESRRISSSRGNSAATSNSLFPDGDRRAATGYLNDLWVYSLDTGIWRNIEQPCRRASSPVGPSATVPSHRNTVVPRRELHPCTSKAQENFLSNRSFRQAQQTTRLSPELYDTTAAIPSSGGSAGGAVCWPHRRAGHSAVIIGHKMIVYGGLVKMSAGISDASRRASNSRSVAGADGHRPGWLDDLDRTMFFGDVWAWDIPSERWELLFNPNPTGPNAAYDATSRSAEALPQYPSGRTLHGATTWRNFLVVVFGQLERNYCPSSTDLTTTTTQAGNSKLPTQAPHVATHVGTGSSAGRAVEKSEPFDEAATALDHEGIWLFSLSSRAWIPIPLSVCPTASSRPALQPRWSRYWHAVTCVNSRLLIFGGVHQSSPVLGDMWAVDLPSGIAHPIRPPNLASDSLSSEPSQYTGTCRSCPQTSSNLPPALRCHKLVVVKPHIGPSVVVSVGGWGDVMAMNQLSKAPASVLPHSAFRQTLQTQRQLQSLADLQSTQHNPEDPHSASVAPRNFSHLGARNLPGLFLIRPEYSIVQILHWWNFLAQSDASNATSIRSRGTPLCPPNLIEWAESSDWGKIMKPLVTGNYCESIMRRILGFL